MSPFLYFPSSIFFFFLSLSVTHTLSLSSFLLSQPRWFCRRLPEFLSLSSLSDYLLFTCSLSHTLSLSISPFILNGSSYRDGFVESSKNCNHVSHVCNKYSLFIFQIKLPSLDKCKQHISITGILLLPIRTKLEMLYCSIALSVILYCVSQNSLHILLIRVVQKRLTEIYPD